MSLANYAENAALNAMFNNASFVVAARYVKLHTGDPGEDGTANAAAETTRKAWNNAAASGGAVANPNDLVWASYPAAETVSHFSIWDASTAGNCIATGALAAPQTMAIGNSLTIPTGQLTGTLD